MTAEVSQGDCRFLGIEQDAEYVDIARRRIAHWQGPLFATVSQPPGKLTER